MTPSLRAHDARRRTGGRRTGCRRAARLGVLVTGLLLAPPGLRAQTVPADTAAARPTPAPAGTLIPPPGAALPPPDTARVRSPRGAVRRALIAPGWGQLYNEQPAKAPFAAAAVLGTGAFAVYSQRRYTRFRRAFLYVSRESGDPSVPDPDNEFARFFPEWDATGRRSASVTRTLRDNARQNRDLAVLGVGVAYALQALDAYVHAQLAGFDVSEDLAVRLGPVPERALSVRLRLP